ncbi:MAG: PPOX class F420-dependent oxidoreductase [Actinomycetota bacterium]|nr:PPOX class F420-dependent oxidoreductase [Actinomycetota bacterium]
MAGLPEELAHFFLDANYATVATVNADGSPQLTVVWVDYEGEHVVFNTAAGRSKPRNIERGSLVSVLAFDGADFNRWVSVTGPAEIEPDADRAHADKLAQQYAGRERFGGTEERLIVRVRPDRVTTYGLD